MITGALNSVNIPRRATPKPYSSLCYAPPAADAIQVGLAAAYEDRILLPDCTFDGEGLWGTYARPFCWLAEGPVCVPCGDLPDLSPRPPHDADGKAKKPGRRPGSHRCRWSLERLLPFVSLAVAVVAFVAAVWRAIRDDFADFLRSEECIQLVRAVV